MSMGKYRMQAITLAFLAFFAIPPAIIPMLKADTIVKSQLPVNASHKPCISTFQNKIAAAIKVAINTAE